MLISGTQEHTRGCSPAPLSPFLFLPASAVAANRISARRRRRPWTCILPGEKEEGEMGEGSGHDVAVRRGHSGLGAACLDVRWQLPPLHTGTCVCACTSMPCLLPPIRSCVLIATGRLTVHLSNCVWPGSYWAGSSFPFLQPLTALHADAALCRDPHTP